MQIIKPTLFVVEGVDGSGKTTLAKYLARVSRSPYLHMSGHKSLHAGMYEYHMETLRSAQYMLGNGMSVVLDRHWPSEFCYGQITRPDMSNKVYPMNDVIKFISTFEPVYIFGLRETVPIRDQYKQLNEAHPFDEDQYIQIWGEYKSLVHVMQRDSNRVVTYDRDKQGHDLMNYLGVVVNEHCQ